ncbi:MAG: ribonuclease D [Rhodospirillales bacterium]|jgi:ribonuclease D|nr:ribonuclease D [Rhodospirillales bacterium]
MNAQQGAPEIHFHIGDLPEDIHFGSSIAIDTETQGLNLNRDRLCVVQLSAGDGTAHLVHFPTADYSAPNLRRILSEEGVTKIFHYARFDVAIIRRYLGIVCTPVYCTKIASKLVRTYTDSHSLKTLCHELLGIELSKEQQSSDWAAPDLSTAQHAYAANDVLYLHALKDHLDGMLVRENRRELAAACYAFLPVRAELDIAGWGEVDIFHH